MKTFFLTAGFLIVGLSQAWSHEAPIPTNDIRFIADHGQLHIRFHSGAPWWVLDVLGEQTPPPTEWTAEQKKAVKTYFDQHFILRADGKRLTSEFIRQRYSEEVWRYYLGSQLDLEFSYTIPQATQILSGEISLYNEDWHPGIPLVSHLYTSGPAAAQLTLTHDQPQFSLSWPTLIRTPFERWRDEFWNGFFFWETTLWVGLILVTLQLQFCTQLKTRFYLLATSAAAIFLAGAFTEIKKEGTGYALGVFVILVGLMVLVEMALRLYHQRLRRVSESQAEGLFNSQVRFLSLLTAGMTLLLLL